MTTTWTNVITGVSGVVGPDVSLARVTATGSTAALTLAARFGVVITPENFSAAGDDSADDTDAVQAAAALLMALGGGCLLLRKRYKMTEALTITATGEQHIAIVGDGQEVSALRFSGATAGGVVYTSSTTTANRKPALTIDGVSVLTSQKNNGVGIRASWANSSIINAPLTIRDVYVGPDLRHTADDGSGFGYWGKGIHATNARNSSILNSYALGERDLSPGTTHCIQLDGECTDFRFSGVRTLEGTYALHIGGTCEGVFVDGGCTLVYCDYGVWFDVAGEPQFSMSGSHVNALRTCVYLNNVAQFTVHDNVFYASSAVGTAPFPDWRGVFVDGALSKYGHIHHNVYAKEAGRTGAASEIAVYIEDAARINVECEHIFSPDANAMSDGVLIGNTATHCRVRNVRTSGVTNPVTLGTGTGNQAVYDNDSGPIFAGAAAQYVQIFGSASANLLMADTGGAANSKYNNVRSDGGATFFEQLNDDLSVKRTPLSISSAGTTEIGGTGAAASLTVPAVAGAAVRLQVNANTTGGTPYLAAVGETNTSLGFLTAGTGSYTFWTAGFAPQFRILPVAGATRCMQTYGSVSGDPVASTSAGNLLLAGAAGTILGATGGNVGFYGTAPAAKPAVTGSRGGNAALASLLTQLAALGLLTDSTSA